MAERLNNMEDEKRKENLNTVEHFVRKNPHLYDKYDSLRILDIMRYGKYPETYHKEILREVLDFLGIIPDSENIYIEFLHQIESLHQIENRNIIEVGCGVFPNLSSRMSLKQKNGRITVYDPRLDSTIQSSDKLILKKEEFTRETPLEDTNLIVGLMPCKGAEALIDQAIANEIDFVLWLCEGGPHGDYFDYFEDEEEWLYSITSIARRGTEDKKMGKLQKKYIKKYSTSYPIIYNSRNN